ncbi:miniconductance mechanosensitive channel MscM [Photobacterium profundum]|uniref:miniconductance mechanosensitive channel MscM n=1 Tax=Photobacterium profundum TaxID=74109 RepID=UPI003D0C9D65
MLKAHHFIFFLFLSLLTAFSTIANEIEDSQAALTSKIEELNQLPNTPETIKELDSYLQAQNQIDKTKEFNIRTRQYQMVTETFPQEADKLKQKIAAYSSTEFPDFFEWGKEELTLEIADQDSALVQLEVTRKNDKNLLLEIEHGIDEFSYQSEALRVKIKKVETKLAKTQHDSSDTAALNETLLLKIEQQFYISQVFMLEAEQLSSGNRRTLTKLKITYANLEIEARQAYRNNLQNMLNRVLRTSADTNIENSDELQENLIDQPPVLRQLIVTNQRLSSSFGSFSTKREQVQQQIKTTNEQITIVSKTADDLDMMSEWLKLSPAFSESLRTRIDRLPSNPPIEALNKNIAQNQINKYEYQQQHDTLSERAKNFTEIETLTSEQQQTAKKLVSANLALLKKIIAASDTLIYQQATLTVAFDRLNNMLIDLKTEATKRLFWAPDAKTFNLNLITDTWEKLKWFFSPFQWVNLLKAPGVIEKLKLFIGIGIIALIIMSLNWCRSRWLKYLEKTSQKIGKVTQDKFSYSYINVFLSFCLAWPVPIIVTITGLLLSSAWQYPFVHHLGQALSLPLALVVYCFMREIVRDNGLFISHFNWDKSVVNKTFIHYRNLLWFYLPMMVIQNFTYLYSDIDISGTLGRLAFIISNIAVSYFHWRMWQVKLPMTYGDVPEGKAHIGHHIFWWALILIPQGLNYAALNGYLGSSQIVMNKMEMSAVIGVITLLIYYLVKRLMLIQKRRLAFERAKIKRQEIIAQRQAEVLEDKDDAPISSELHIEIEEPEVDLDKISAQSLRLLRSLLLLIYVAVLSLIWDDLYQAITLLEDISLWDVTSTINGIEQLSAITIKSVLLAILAIFLTGILARDLPGAMELLILQHLDLSPGTGYAITSLTRYFAIFTGIIIGSGLIGFDWSKMQWLVAALGVGIGFGMQEIFANFISGIIILFEKPIRIGDTVTIRELTGVVAKIKTRATTIVDWDRKEVIVPNKSFVTEQFINWSLSDAITRVTLTISVQYLSDSELVTQLLFEAADECELVLDNPAPEVFFLGLTANCQNFEVRAYAAETGHRLGLTHDLHCRIKSKFIKHDISIASPQLEVSIKDKIPHPFAK